ncbi:Glycosyltransferase RgtA/B/C/D-like [Flavobacteriaceae bacterium]
MVVFIVLLLLFLFMNNLNHSIGFKELILKTVLIFSGFIVFITELLSLFKSLNLISVALSWSSLSLILILFLLKDKKETFATLKNIKGTTFNYYKSLSIASRILLFFIIVALLSLLLQGLIYPPNNWDSMTYHMSRIMHWLSNEYVSHFPTHILRHLYQPPFAEYFIMNINLLNGNDNFSNSVQLFYLTFSIIGIWSILDYFNCSRFHKLLAAFLLITIPSAELQATTTKNDIVCGFFVIIALYYCIKTYYEININNFIFLGLSIGLAIFTKGTAYLFLAPFLVFLAIFLVHKLIQTKNLKIITNGLLLLFVVLIINIGHFSRNYMVNKNILTVDTIESKGFTNENRSTSQFASNLLKNFGLQIGFPFQNKYDLWIREIHKKYNVNIDSPDANWLQNKYQGTKKFETHEDIIPNTIHFFLILFCSLIILSMGIINPKKYLKELLLLTVVLLQLVFFVFYLKWQPWHTRLHIPIFMISTLLVIVVLKQFRWFSIVLFVCMPLLIYGFYFNFIYNNLRPIKTNLLYTKNIHIKDSRFKKYFSNQPYLFDEYNAVQDLIYKKSPKKVGLIISDWEYPLFSDFYYEKINILCINVGNITNKIQQNTKNVDAIISTNPETDSILFEGKKYINITPNNFYIWYYK